MSLEKRIEKLEKRTESQKQMIIIVLMCEGDLRPTEAQEEAAIADFKAKNPDRKEGDVIVLHWKHGQFEVPKKYR